MDSQSMDALFVRGHPQGINKNKSSGGGRSKSLGKYLRKCWKCGKASHYKKDHISKNVDKGKGFNDIFHRREDILIVRRVCLLGFYKHAI
jgi:hypothetical protein